MMATALGAVLHVVLLAEPPGGTPALDDLQGLLDVTVVSGASRAQQRAEDAPATISVVTAEDLRRYGLRTVHEAINFLSVGLVAQDPLRAVEVGSRGVLLSGDFGDHLLVVVDGHTLNEQWNGTAYVEQGLGIPIEVIDHIEFIVGPGSVLYGSNAMLGVVNIVTKRARDVGHVNVVIEGSALPPQGVDGAPQFRWPGFGGTARVSLLVGHETTLAGKPFEVSLAAEYFAHSGQSLTFAVQDGLTDTDGTKTWPQRWGPRAPAPGSWGGTTTSAWWTQVPTGVLTVRWGDFTLWARGTIYGRGTPGYDSIRLSGDFDSDSHEVDRWASIELRWARTLSSQLQVMVRAYADAYDYSLFVRSSSWAAYGDGTVPDNTDLTDFSYTLRQRAPSRWAGLEAQGAWDWLGDGRFPILVGVDARLRHFNDATIYSTGGVDFGTTNVYSVDEWQVAVWAQQRARLDSRLEFNVGVRLDTQSGFPARLSPRAALVWTTPWDGRFKLVANSAFRTPSGYERFAQYGNWQIRNPALKPESVVSGEVDYEQRVARHRFVVGAFVSNFMDMIGYVEAPGEPTDELRYWYANQGSLLNVGGQGLVEGTVGKLKYAASLTAAGNKTSEQLVASPGWFGNARVSWDFGEGLPQLSLLGSFSGERLTTTAFATGVDAAGQEVGWNPRQRVVGPQAELRLAVTAPLAALKGLWVRGVAGGQLMPFSAYTVGPRQSPDPQAGFTSPAQLPNSRLFVMLTLGWSLDGR